MQTQLEVTTIVISRCKCQIRVTNIKVECVFTLIRWAELLSGRVFTHFKCLFKEAVFVWFCDHGSGFHLQWTSWTQAKKNIVTFNKLHLLTFFFLVCLPSSIVYQSIKRVYLLRDKNVWPHLSNIILGCWKVNFGRASQFEIYLQGAGSLVVRFWLLYQNSYQFDLYGERSATKKKTSKLLSKSRKNRISPSNFIWKDISQ